MQEQQNQKKKMIFLGFFHSFLYFPAYFLSTKWIFPGTIVQLWVPRRLADPGTYQSAPCIRARARAWIWAQVQIGTWVHTPKKFALWIWMHIMAATRDRVYGCRLDLVWEIFSLRAESRTIFISVSKPLLKNMLTFFTAFWFFFK